MTPVEQLVDAIGNKLAYAVIIGGLIGLGINVLFTILDMKRKRNRQNQKKRNYRNNRKR